MGVFSTYASRKDNVLQKRPDINTVEIKTGDRIAIHVVSSGSGWKLILGPHPFGRTGGTSKNWVDGRKVVGSIRGNKGLIMFAVEVLGKIAQTGDGLDFAYAIELKQKLHDIIYGEDSGSDLAHRVERLFKSLGKEHAQDNYDALQAYPRLTTKKALDARREVLRKKYESLRAQQSAHRDGKEDGNES